MPARPCAVGSVSELSPCSRAERALPPIGAPAGARRRNDRGAQIWVFCVFGVGASLDASEVVPGRVRWCTSPEVRSPGAGRSERTLTRVAHVL